MRAAWLVLLGACYQESSAKPCTLTCDEAPCPSDLVCGSDHLCQAAGMADCTLTMTDGPLPPATALYIKSPTPQAGSLFGTSVALSSDGSTLAVGAPTNGQSPGLVYVFTWDGSAYSVLTTLAPIPGDPGDMFGASVSLSSDGSVVAVGAPFEDGSGVGVDPPVDNLATDAGAVYVSTRTGTVWVTRYLKAGVDHTQFGASVALNAAGNQLAIGAPGPNVVMAIKAYEWTSPATITGFPPAVPDPADRFGTSVAIDDTGASLIVGADREDSAATGVGGDATNNSATDSGAAYLLPTASLSQVYFKASNTAAGDRFGASVGCTSATNIVTVGAPLAGGAGAVYIFTAISGSPPYLQEHIVTDPAPTAGDHFGQALAFTGDGKRLAVGAPGASSGQGAAFVFSNSWTSVGPPLAAFNADAGDAFGTSIAVSGDHNVIAVGAPQEASASAANPNDNSAAGAGAVYVFR
jgi:hypothetical protein